MTAPEARDEWGRKVWPPDDLDVYLDAIAGKGDTFEAANWQDKPHRLVYDLVAKLREERVERDALRRLVADAHEAHPTSLAWAEVTGGMDAALDAALEAADAERGGS